MKCFIGLGSSLGDRLSHLERAANALAELSYNRVIRVSAIYETPALVPAGAPTSWNSPYLNAVGVIDWLGAPTELLHRLKDIEKEIGRTAAARWAPRVIDLDLLLFGDEIVESAELRIPHSEMLNRSFVLDPLKDLDPLLRVPGSQLPIVTQARKLKNHSPWIMAILNVTPDSFSDGGEAQTPQAIEAKIARVEKAGVQAIDIGAESTRPHAELVSQSEEQSRLEPVLNCLRSRRTNSQFKPYVSLDTRRAQTAAFALKFNIDCINDVSGLEDPAMLELLSASTCDYVLMHSLSVPADPGVTLSPGCDPVREVKNWLDMKIEILKSKGIDLRRIIFDPGLGFGKTRPQSVELLERIDEFAEIPLRLLVGHSRKSFLRNTGEKNRVSLDASTLAWSKKLARKGVDILRVHDFESHAATFKSAMEEGP